jgi:4-carboxymuconolactone decarboxylase
VSRAIKIPDEQIAAIERGELDAACFDERAQSILRFAAQILDQPRPDDQAFALMAEHFSPAEIVEVFLLVGNYWMLAKIMTGLDIEIDPIFGHEAIDVAEERLAD